jgi:hypothetical protein
VIESKVDDLPNGVKRTRLLTTERIRTESQTRILRFTNTFKQCQKSYTKKRIDAFVKRITPGTDEYNEFVETNLIEVFPGYIAQQDRWNKAAVEHTPSRKGVDVFMTEFINEPLSVALPKFDELIRSRIAGIPPVVITPELARAALETGNKHPLIKEILAWGSAVCKVFGYLKSSWRTISLFYIYNASDMYKTEGTHMSWKLDSNFPLLLGFTRQQVADTVSVRGKRESDPVYKSLNTWLGLAMKMPDITNLLSVAATTTVLQKLNGQPGHTLPDLDDAKNWSIKWSQHVLYFGSAANREFYTRFGFNPYSTTVSLPLDTDLLALQITVGGITTSLFLPAQMWAKIREVNPKGRKIAPACKKLIRVNCKNELSKPINGEVATLPSGHAIDTRILSKDPLFEELHTMYQEEQLRRMNANVEREMLPAARQRKSVRATFKEYYALPKGRQRAEYIAMREVHLFYIC